MSDELDRLQYLLEHAELVELSKEPHDVAVLVDAVAVALRERDTARRKLSEIQRVGKWTWDETFLAMADVVAKRSGCLRAQCGAVIVDRHNRVRSTGYNGAPAHLQGYRAKVDATCEIDCPRYKKGKAGEDLDPGYDDCITVHSEANALLFCDRSDIEGGTIYVTGAVCYGCAKLIANSGLVRAVYKVHPDESHRAPERVRDFLRRAGLRVVIHEESPID